MKRQLPKQITSGLSLSAKFAFDGYTPPIWSATLIMRGPDQTDLIALESGTGFIFAAAANDTTNWSPGNYSYEVRVSDGIAVHCVETGQIEVLRDITKITAAHDPRGHSQIVLSSIEAVIEGRATLDQESYKINNRELSRTPISDLLMLRETYRKEVAREASGRKHPRLLGRTVRARF